MVLTEILARNARVYGDRIALIERDPGLNRRREITWEQFYRQSNAFSNALINMGVAKGDRVVHLMMNCLEWLPLYFGILRAGAVAVPLNFRFEAPAISRCTNLCEAGIIVFGEEFTERITQVKTELDKSVSKYIYAGTPDKCPDFAIALSEALQGRDPAEPDVEVNPWDGAGIYFTSGTTGEPKGVYFLHRQLEFACYVENRHHNQEHSDNFLCIPPLYHTGAKMHWFGNFIVGARAVILKGVSPQAILEAVSEEKITIVWLLVPWAHDILVAIENNELRLQDYNLKQWRLMHIGAQPVPPTLIENWQKVFPGQQYDTNYGLTEATGPGCVHLGIENTHKAGAIGRAGFDWECRVVDDYGKDLPPEVPGELLVKGPGVMEFYYRNSEATRSVLKNGWLHTGDIVKKDHDGFFWLIDRKKDVIITGGENIFPVEIESYLMTHRDILDAAVIGLPDRRLGEIVAAVISPKPGRSLTEVQIMDFCAEIPRYKRPRKIFFDSVPRNPTGKIEKPRLRKKYADSAAG
ncbi:MAG: AMP-binding protein [Desulfobacteraceae bacterium]|nr:AMP-binding protein [Desulfobacteraceae bacterium]